MKTGVFEDFMRELDSQADGDQRRGKAFIRPRSAAELQAMIGGLGVSGFKVDIKD